MTTEPAIANPVLAGYRLLTQPSQDQHSWLGVQVSTAPARRDADGFPATAHVLLATADRLTRRRVHAEATMIESLLAAVDSPAVAGLLAHAVDSDGRPVLITASIGPSLAMELAGRGPLAIGDVLAAARAAAAGLDALHRAGQLHRAISPRALLRGQGRHGQVQLASPTLPLLAEQVAATADGTGHEPPEVLAGNDWTPAAEIYALASTLWTLLTGRPPSSGSQEERLTALLGAGSPSVGSPRTRRPDMPDSVAAALARALDTEPADRPHSPLQLVAELTRERGPAVSSDQQVARPPSRSMADQGRPLGRGYRLDARIGSGSAGTVYRARRLTDNKVLAAKLLRAELADDPDAVSRFLGERTTLMRLRHPNLVKVHDLVAEGSDLAIVMDLVEGVDLRQMIKARRLDRTDALRLLSQIADALAAVHAAGIVHRDLKPENVLVSEGHTALLTDFGLARVIDRPTVTQQNELVGTPAYLAPELATGGRVTPACDVYALGVTGYELLAGHRPFRADNAMAMLRAHIEDRPRRPPEMPDQEWALLSACLDKQPTARPTAEQMVKALTALATGVALPSMALPSLAPATSSVRPLPVPGPMPMSHDNQAGGEPQPTMAATRPPPVAPMERVAARRRRWPLVIAVSVIAAVGAAIGIWLGGTGRSSSHPPVTSTGSPAPTGESAPLLRPIPINATVRADGVVELSWSSEVEKLPGFQSYAVFRNGKPIAPTYSAGSTRYPDIEPGPNPCYLVFALGVPPRPSAPPVPPLCPTVRN